MADAAFFTRRKTIANSLRAYFAAHPAYAPVDVDALLDRCDIDRRTRGESLYLDDYIQLGITYEGLTRLHTKGIRQ